MQADKIAAIESKLGAKIAGVLRSAAAANNGRLCGLSMTESEKFSARRACKLGLMTEHSACFPGFGFVPMFQIAA